ncbi:DNA-directed DNA polymerase [Synchytrium endobioticum]|uniref:DNA-directed DNA polymerase n=1 Tax=Synchytrium endobioticum TaxID=286115 RepID=A0A507C3L2_9FUNG|nr:DNA-directed DNA polymerase [Synchytrium endobioticum]
MLSCDNTPVTVYLIRVFGCVVYINLKNDTSQKLDDNGKQCFLLGYHGNNGQEIKGYRVSDGNKIYLSRNASFMEMEKFYKIKTTSYNSTIDMIVDTNSENMQNQISTQRVMTSYRESTNHIPSLDSESESSSENELNTEDNGDSELGGVRRSTRTRKQPIRYGTTTNVGEMGTSKQTTFPKANHTRTRVITPPLRFRDQQESEPSIGTTDPDLEPDDAGPADALVIQLKRDVKEPLTYKQAVLTPESSEWLKSMAEEVQSLIENETWKLVPLPAGSKAIGGKWVFKVKRDNMGEIDKLKSRWVALGYTQKLGIDFEETFAPTSHLATIRLFLSIVASEGCVLRQLDIKTAFLYGELESEFNIYMKQPTGFEDKKYPDQVCKLVKAIYGLKQAPRCWYLKLSSWLVANGFCQKLDSRVIMYL